MIDKEKKKLALTLAIERYGAADAYNLDCGGFSLNSEVDRKRAVRASERLLEPGQVDKSWSWNPLCILAQGDCSGCPVTEAHEAGVIVEWDEKNACLASFGSENVPRDVLIDLKIIRNWCWELTNDGKKRRMENSLESNRERFMFIDTLMEKALDFDIERYQNLAEKRFRPGSEKDDVLIDGHLCELKKLAESFGRNYFPTVTGNTVCCCVTQNFLVSQYSCRYSCIISLAAIYKQVEAVSDKYRAAGCLPTSWRKNEDFTAIFEDLQKVKAWWHNDAKKSETLLRDQRSWWLSAWERGW